VVAVDPALRALIDRNHELVQAAPPELAAIVPELATNSPVVGADSATRVRVFDAAGQALSKAATSEPVVVILDDLHSADQSTVDLLRFMAHEPQLGALMLVGAYRPHESSPGVAATLADLASAAELVPLRGLAPDEIADLVQAVAGASAPDDWARLVYERSGGHPFCAAVLEAAAVAGGTLLPDVLAEVTGNDTNQIGALVAEATAAGILAPARHPEAPAGFVHDLYREAIYTMLAPARRVQLHHRVANALLRRQERGSPVFPVELAYHFTAAILQAGTQPAVTWSHAAARADATRFAFSEAAGGL
jgi:predicted ATPase